ncbi:MAG: hypothetical protein KOO66_10965 [Bacteroidales bacterium]|nr:hypothetical protein [Bacteroidales bacterium]
MNLRSLIIITMAIFWSVTVKSQSRIDASNAHLIEYQLSDYYNDYVTTKIGTKTVMSYKNIEGDPYLYKDFTKGTIKFEEGKNIVGKLRYNMYSDEIEFVYWNNVLILVYEDSFNGIKLGDYNIVQLSCPNVNKQNNSGYFIALANGNYDLFCKKSVRFLEQEEPKLYKESKPGRFVKNPSLYYLKQPEKELYEISSIGKLKNFSTELASMVDEYSAENKLRVNEKSLTDFFNWLNAK